MREPGAPAVQLSSAAPTGPPREERGRHLPELDGLRGIAVMLVVLLHVGDFFPSPAGDGASAHLVRAVVKATRPGYLGVDVFFVLSGFLIAGILLDTTGRPGYYRNFYARRVLRIFPLYFLSLGVMLPFFGWPWRLFGLCAVFLANVAPLFGVPLLMGPLWSLSVEEHFYLVLPWVVRFARRGTVAVLALLTLAAEPTLRAWAFRAGCLDETYTWFRLDGLACGVLVALLVRSGWPEAARRRLAIAAVVLGGAVFAIGVPFGSLTRTRMVGASLVYWCASLMVAGLVAACALAPGHRLLAPLRIRPLRYLGDISYFLYLAHLYLIVGFYRAIDALFHRPWSGGVVPDPAWALLLHAAVVLTCAILLGEASRRWFEGPIRGLRVRFQ